MPKRLILASASPRRKELLALLGMPFDVIPSDLTESLDADFTPSSLVEHLATAKATEVADRALYKGEGSPDVVILGADTIVVSDATDPPEVLGKPASIDDARRMLAMLGGTSHTVLTGLALHWYQWLNEHEYYTPLETTRVVDTQVQFRELTPEMIDAYIATGEPFDKAGAYGIQGYASAFVEAVYGDYFNVVGLPISTVAKMLEEIGIEWWRGPAALE